jgi:hypothetical protein
MDSAYTAKYLAVAKMLWDASEGNPARIPGHYAEHLHHRYSDGDISMAHLLPKFDYVEGLENYELEEAIEMLGKVSPDDWPFSADIQCVNAEELLRIYDDDACSMDFAETPGTTSEKAELVLRHAIESVFGDKVDKVRSSNGQFPDVDNQYLQQPDGSFKGSFEYSGNKFDFTIEPDETSWTMQYRMAAASLDKLPPVTNVPHEDGGSHQRGWK